MIVSHYRGSRRGSLVVCVMVCLLVASALVTSSVHTALRARREVHMSHQMEQTHWLLEAGVRRAVAALRQSSDYDGETWRPDGAITRFPGALVEIRVTGNAGDAREVEVIASLGVDLDQATTATVSLTRRTHRLTVQSESFPESDPSSAE